MTTAGPQPPPSSDPSKEPQFSVKVPLYNNQAAQTQTTPTIVTQAPPFTQPSLGRRVKIPAQPLVKDLAPPQITLDQRPVLFRGITFLADGQRGWITGTDGTILSTKDGGESWQAQVSPTGADINAITFQAEGLHGLAAGSEGTLLWTHDGGQIWHITALDTKANLEGIVLLPDGQHGWAAGLDGTILATKDGGQSWQRQESRTKEHLHEISFLPDGQRGWAAGSRGTLLVTRDGGQSWRRQKSVTDRDLYALDVLTDGQHGWAAGDAGTLLVMGDGGRGWKTTGQYACYPAPWFWAASIGVIAACTAFMMWRILQQRILALRNRIMTAAVDDGPISDIEKDRLGFGPIVKGLAAFMRHESTRPPVTFAITAPWGRGKSSLMRMLQSRLQSQRVPTVWFNAWHHQQEPVMLAPLLDAITKQAIPPWTSWIGARFRFHLLWNRFKERPWLGLGPLLLGAALGLALPISAVGLLVFQQSGQPNRVIQYWADFLADLTQLLLPGSALAEFDNGNAMAVVTKLLEHIVDQPATVLAIPIAAYVLVSLWLLFCYFLNPFPASPSALLASLGDRFNLKRAKEQTGLRQLFRDHFTQVCEAILPYTLTIFIDDLDRCEPQKSAEMLEAVNYLADAGKCFIVLGIARPIVEAQLGEAFKDIAERHAAFADLAKAREEEPHVPSSQPSALEIEEHRQNYARNYLRKLIQIEIPVPCFTDKQLRHLMDDSASRVDDWDALWTQWRLWRHKVVLALKYAGLLFLLGVSVSETRSWLEIREAETGRLAEELLGNYQNRQERLFEVAGYLRWKEGTRKDEAPQNNPLESAARFEQLSFLKKEMDEAMPLLEAQARAGREQAFQGTRAKIDKAWNQILAIQSTDPAWQKTTPMKAPNPPASPQSQAPSQAEPGVPKNGAIPPTDAYPLWPYRWSFLILAAMGGLLVLRSRDRYRIVESQDYRTALEQWRSSLMRLGPLQSPRETKRFLNLSRYLTLRINAREYEPREGIKTWLGRRFHKLPATPSGKTVSEANIVHMTALYLIAPESARHDSQSFQGFLQKPAVWPSEGTGPVRTESLQISKNEIQEFLKAVGDIEL